MAYQDLTPSMDLSNVGNLPNSIAMLARARQRGFNAAATGDLGDALSEGMSTPNDDLLTEALTEQNAQVGNAKGVGGGPNGLGFGTAQAQQAPGDIVGNAPGAIDNTPLSLQGLNPRKRYTQGTTYSTPIEQ